MFKNCATPRASDGSIMRVHMVCYATKSIDNRNLGIRRHLCIEKRVLSVFSMRKRRRDSNRKKSPT